MGWGERRRGERHSDVEGPLNDTTWRNQFRKELESAASGLQGRLKEDEFIVDIYSCIL